MGHESNEIWHKGSLGNENDARTSNTCRAQRNRAIPYSMLNKRCPLHSAPTNRQQYDWQHIAHPVLWQRCDHPEAFASGFGDDQSHYWFVKFVAVFWEILVARSFSMGYIRMM